MRDDDISLFDICDKQHDEEESLELDILTKSKCDDTLDLTYDNIINNEGFMTTDSGDETQNVTQHDEMLAIDGHVIFNQAGRCTTRHNQTISETSCQRYIVQFLYATTSGQA